MACPTDCPTHRATSRSPFDANWPAAIVTDWRSSKLPPVDVVEMLAYRLNRLIGVLAMRAAMLAYDPRAVMRSPEIASISAAALRCQVAC